MNYDILIIGGGLVGMSLARGLANTPYRIGIIEANLPETRFHANFDSRSVALNDMSLKILRRFGFELSQSGFTPIETIDISEQGRFAKARMVAERIGVSAFGQVAEMPVLGKMLFDGVPASVTWLSPMRLQSITPGSEQTTVCVRDEADEAHELSCKLLVAADGTRSFTRETLSIEANIKDYGQSAVVANVQLASPHQQVAYERFTPQGPMALLPLTDNRGALIWSMPDTAEHMACSDEAFIHKLYEAVGYQFGQIERVGKRFSFPLQRTIAREQVFQRGVLLGNSAHTLHPVAGQGFNLALRDVYILCRELAGSSDPGDAACLARYLAKRQSDQTRTDSFTDGLIRLFSNRIFPLTRGRSAALALFDNLMPAKRWLARRNMGYEPVFNRDFFAEVRR